MKISELVARLEMIRAMRGDIQVIAEDGLDPSDPALVIDVEVWDPDSVRVPCHDKQTFAFICT